MMLTRNIVAITIFRGILPNADGACRVFYKIFDAAGDVVLDPFAGSNTTGAAAEKLKRRWISIEPNAQYIASSKGDSSP